MTKEQARWGVTILACVALCATAQAGDWPMWRYDSHRSAASPEELPGELHLEWSRHLSLRVPAWDDPLNHDLMPYDRVFEPIVLGRRMFVGFNDADKLVAYDIETGAELWTFFCDGPVRLPPAAWRDRIFFCSDDGALYCVRAADGGLIWKFSAAPSPRKVLGNRRLISSWPARGGPVVRDGVVYFAAGIWPFMGVFIYALRADTGDVLWVDDTSGSEYIVQPHGAPAFGGVAPQGACVATENILLVPGGRGMPAALDRRTGRRLHFAGNPSKGNGGSFVAATEDEFFVHTRRQQTISFDLVTGARKGFAIGEPVLDGTALYAASGGLVQAVDGERKQKWKLATPLDGDIIKAGRRLYIAGADSIVAVEIPAPGESPRVAWSTEVASPVQRLLAAGGKLFAVTIDGTILAYGAGTSEVRTWRDAPDLPTPATVARERARSIVDEAAAHAGYALCFGLEGDPLLDGLLAESELQIVAVEPRAEDVRARRRALDRAGVYGARVAVVQGTPASFQAPPYLANLIVLGRAHWEEAARGEGLALLFQSLRPYGGAMWVPAARSEREAIVRAVESGALPGARLVESGSGLFVFRDGPLPGSAPWTHQYGNIANTVKSDDRLVKAPLGVLWFGGNSNLDVLPRHGHGPPEQVIGGRLFIEGMDMISARDVYTGRVLWKTTVEDLGNDGVFFDQTYREDPLEITYNQVHIPGANARGTNFVATVDSVYVAAGVRCRVLTAENGEERMVIEMPDPTGSGTVPWGFIGVYEDVLLGGQGFAAPGGGPDGSTPASSAHLSTSRGLVAFDRHSGQVRWRSPARYGFLHNGIVAGNDLVFCLDRRLGNEHDAELAGAESLADGYRILCLDVDSGTKRWEVPLRFPGTWLGYSQEHDILLLAGAMARDRSPDESGKGMAAFRGRSGELLWAEPELDYIGPCMLHGETIITNNVSYRRSAGARSLLDGSPWTVPHPLTGEDDAWAFERTYGCNTVIASEHLLTFRSGAASYYDLTNHAGVFNIGGIRSGCTANLVVADGVLNAPDYTRTCLCHYQNQTSLALVPMPELVTWSVSTFQIDGGRGDVIRRVGINLGAPGDRVDEAGTLWLDFPSVGGLSPQIDVRIGGSAARPFRDHPTRIPAPDPARAAGFVPPAWVAASGIRDLETLSVARAPSEPRVMAVASSPDDAVESEAGQVMLRGETLGVAHGETGYLIGLRLEDVRGLTAENLAGAWLQLTAGEAGSETARVVIRMEASDDAPAFQAVPFDLSSRPRTRGAVTWKSDPWAAPGDAGIVQRSPDVSLPLREVLSRPGWREGHAVVFLVEVQGMPTAASFDGDASWAPRLFYKRKGWDEETFPVLPPEPFTVRLHFHDPDALSPGARVFDIFLQGERLLADFDIAVAAATGTRGVIKEFPAVPIGTLFHLDLRRKPGCKFGPVLSGLEILPE
jgi:outer membrane protein assembly factor BamB